MELSVRVQRVKGGVDLSIRIVFHRASREMEVTSELYWFTANQLGAWAIENGVGDYTQGTQTFNKLYEAACKGEIKVARQCSRVECHGRSCRGVHELAGDDFALVSEEAISGLQGVGPARLELAKQYRDFWHDRVFDPTAEGA